MSTTNEVDVDGDTFFIAEVANIHEGCPAVVESVIDQFSCVADAIKFQAFKPDELAVESFELYEQYQEWSFSEDEWARLVDRAAEAGLVVLADVFGPESAEQMERLGVDGFKIHNADLSNASLLKQVGSYGKPVYLSAGGSTEHELRVAKNILNSGGTESVSLMYGVQNYPTAVEDSNLGRLPALNKEFDCEVGFASHVDVTDPLATQVPVWAVGAGADILELHVTHNREETAVDVESSLEIEQFREVRDRVAELESSWGTESLSLTESEREYRSNSKKWVVSTREMEAGEEITKDNTALRRIDTSRSDSVRDHSRVLGSETTRRIPEMEVVGMTDIDQKVVAALATRAESTRLYGKPMQLVGERPILQHLVERLDKVDQINEIGLGISDAPSQSVFSEFASEHGLPSVVGPVEDVLKRLILLADHTDADILVRATTENPYVYYQNVDKLITKHIESNADLTVTNSLPLGSIVEVISVDALRQAHRVGDDRHRSELCTLYITEHTETFDVQSLTPPEELQRPDIRLTVDNPSDLILVREIWKEVDETETPPLEEVLSVYDANPQLQQINDHKPDGTTPEVIEVAPHIYGEAEYGVQ